MSYNSSTQVITSPVSIYDIQRAIGSTSPDLGTLCSDENINRWAKYKPLSIATLATIGSNQRENANYGIVDIPTWTRLDYAVIFLFSDARGSLANTYWPDCDRAKGSLSLEYWTYEKPSGGASSPYRITDYDGYYHLAEAPIGPMQQTSILISPVGTLRVKFKQGAVSNDTLKLSDLTWPGSSGFPIGDMYFGVLMKKTSGGATYAVTQKNGSTDIKMSDTDVYGFWAEFSEDIVSASFEGTWTIIPIISSIAIAETTSISQQNGNKFLAPLPFHTQPITVSIEWAQVLIIAAHGYKDGTSQQRYAEFEFTLQATEQAAGRYRNYSITVTLCDAQGNQLPNYSGGTSSGQIVTNASGTAVVTKSIRIYIAQIWSSDIYYKANLTITDTLKFRKTSQWTLTGPIQIVTPTPEI